MFYSNPDEIVEKVIEKVGKNIVVGTPLGAGKANNILNALYRKAKSDKSIHLKIMTALTLEKPKGKSLLEKNFLGPMAERLFGDYLDLDYELDRVKEQLPENIEVVEFYFPAGKYKNNKTAQRNYISTNYTHVYRDMLDHGVNVLTQIVCEGDYNSKASFSLSCNPDVAADLMPALQAIPNTAIVFEVNSHLPFMYGDAVVAQDNIEFVLKNKDLEFKIFGPPKMSVPDVDFMIGLNSSVLVKDDGELQVGIGSLGDSVVYALNIRHEKNKEYLRILDKFQIPQKNEEVIKKLGSLDTFEKGLFGATEMLVDGFMHLYKSGILKKKVYDHIGLQRLLNEEVINETVTPKTLEILKERHFISNVLNIKDIAFLKHFGIFREDVKFEIDKLVLGTGESFDLNLNDKENLTKICEYCLGKELKEGHIVHGGFFVGPQEFYDFLNNLSETERRLIHMKSVRKINQLYGHEELDRLHRKNARFINTCLMMTLSGAAVSDGLEDGTIISGVGGQYNFVAMAQELPDGYSIIQLRSTRGAGAHLKSNIVWNYGHITIPRHLRDIVVTEYGIANIRGKTDEDIIKELLNIADSKFQESLLAEAKSYGKISQDYQIPAQFKNNFPEQYLGQLKELKKEGYFNKFPFGTDLTEEEIIVGGALKKLKALSLNKPSLIKAILFSFFSDVPEKVKPYLKRMKLDKPSNLQERIFQKLLVKFLK